MDPINYNDESINFDDLLSDGNYPTLWDNLPFSNDLELQDDFNNLLSSLPQLTNDEQPINDVEDIFAGFQNVLEVPQSETQDSLNGEQPIENASVDRNPPVVSDLLPQPVAGNEEGIMYQMCPMLSGHIRGQMSVKQQPKANYRFRYACDGARFLPQARYNPMSINLPDLRLLPLCSNQKLGIIMTIATTTLGRTIVHVNDILYRVPGAIKIGYGSVFVPIDNADMESGEKKFPRFSILYQKVDDYTFDMIPFDPYSMFGIAEKYVGNSKKKTSNAAKGKEFKREYNLLSYKIVFQLALKEDNVIFISHTTCETEIIDESKPNTSSNKRSASSLSEPIFEEKNTSGSSCSNPTKKLKSLMTGLPVTQVFNTTERSS